MGCAVSCYFSPVGPSLHSVWASIEAGVIAVEVITIHYRSVVDMVDVDVADVIDRAVIGEVIPMPVAALVANSHIAEAIVYAPIESDITAPVTGMVAVAATRESPITRRPESAIIRRLRPRTGNPVVSV
jgi:hypothetical protein